MTTQIDTHVHVVSDDVGTYPLNPDGPADAWYRVAACSVEQLLELMDEAGVTAAVLVQGVSAYGSDNRYTAASARRFPDRCTSVGCVDLAADEPEEAVRDLIEEEDMHGIRWWGLGDVGLAEPHAVWGTAYSLGVPMVVTILPNRLGELAETVPAIPPIPIALDHCGFADFSRGVPAELAALAAAPTVHLKVSTIVLDQIGEHGDVREAVADLAAVFGSSRLMWGSDWSQTHDRPYPELAEYARDAAAKLGDDDRDLFLGGTAATLWPELAP